MDEAKKQAFSAFMGQAFNNTGAVLALGVGRRTGLLDAMGTTEGKPFTIAELAAKAKASERYVREWLGVLVCAKVVELHGESAASDEQQRFVFPPEHAVALTTMGGPSNMSVYCDEWAMLAKASYDLLCTHMLDGQGIAYEPFAKQGFYACMSAMTTDKLERTLVSQFLAKGFPEMQARLEAGIRVLDVGCGNGTASLLLAKAFPKSTFVGLDISAEGVAKGTTSAAEAGLANVSFVCGDAATMHTDPVTIKALGGAGSFQYITAFDAIHDQTRPAAALDAIHALLADDGTFSLIDIDAGSRIADNTEHPFGAFLYGVSLFHCMPVGRCNGGPGLGAMWGRARAEAMLKDAKFEVVAAQKPPADSFNVEYRCRKAAK